MAANELHHFVPQFYLRNFSIEGQQGIIQLYNHETSRFIPKASIKGQAREKFFYGKDDDVEKDLGKLEGAVGLLFHDPITKIIPPVELESFNLFREFVIIQLFRTKKAANEMLNSINAAFGKIAPTLNILLPPGGKLWHKHPALVTLFNAIEHLPLMNHLAIKSIVNLTEIPFITSDAPVALYNQWREKCGTYMGATALAAKGLQIFLPIHPRLMYCLYDPYVYDCGSEESLIIKSEIESDIHQLNSLQYLFSDTHIYSDNHISSEYFEYIIREMKKFRVSSRSISEIKKIVNPDENEQRILLFNSFEDPHFDLDLSFCGIKKEIQTSLSDGAFPLRHSSFVKLLSDLDNNK